MTTVHFDNSYAQLPDGFFTRVSPAQSPEPHLLKVNEALAGQLGLDVDFLRSEDGVHMLSGNRLPVEADPLSMVYAGHQFGGWSAQLGDGRAILLGEIVDQNGLRLDVQLKGAGRTPYSRGGDGKAAIGPVLREYIVSEAMAALRVPTTRALAAVTTGEMIVREGPVPGAILTRVAQSHVRVGTFQYFAAREDVKAVKILADYVIDRHYPQSIERDNPYIALVEAVIERQAKLIAQWMNLGFIHGVMNTDNMQIVGETIDYGPCAFMDEFHPATVFSSIDRNGRYAWNNQPLMGQWNVARLVESLLPLLHEDADMAIKQAEDVAAGFYPLFNRYFLEGAALKLGLFVGDKLDEAERDAAAETVGPEVRALIQNGFEVMTENHVDFTRFFSHLTRIASGGEETAFLALFQNKTAGAEWLTKWRTLFEGSAFSQTDMLEKMRLANPIFIPRNHLVEQAIQAGLQDDFAPFHQLVEVLSRPFDEQPHYAHFEQPPRPEEVVHQTFCGT